MLKKNIAVITLALWTFIILTFMIMAYTVNLEIFFVLWLIGLLIITELIDTKNVETTYLKFIKWIIGISVIIFAYIVIKKIMEILSS